MVASDIRDIFASPGEFFGWASYPKIQPTRNSRREFDL